MSKPRWTVHFKDYTWDYYGRQLSTHHVDDGHRIRMHFERTTKHKPPRAMWHIYFPATKAVKVYVTYEEIDGVTHVHCTSVNKKNDVPPEHYKGREGNLGHVSPDRGKNSRPIDLSQVEGT